MPSVKFKIKKKPKKDTRKPNPDSRVVRRLRELASKKER